ncbi:MAG: DUF1156 domain-containing protein [Candidatus Atribacteria bacterium]|nr:DUF1156 domain-containing protein [Candidatus Atribacteria bacterium]
MPEDKMLIEVAMPIKEISTESVRDKSIRYGHISTLYLWWRSKVAVIMVKSNMTEKEKTIWNLWDWILFTIVVKMLSRT